MFRFSKNAAWILGNLVLMAIVFNVFVLDSDYLQSSEQEGQLSLKNESNAQNSSVDTRLLQNILIANEETNEIVMINSNFANSLRKLSLSLINSCRITYVEQRKHTCESSAHIDRKLIYLIDISFTTASAI